jgi:hypothetical protein
MSLDIAPILNLLQSNQFLEATKSKRIDLAPPATSDQVETTRSRLGEDVLQQLLPLLRISRGFDLYPEGKTRGSFPDLVVNFTVESADNSVWPNVYPLGIEGGMLEEMLCWDVGGNPPGIVYFIHHDGPWHCPRFSSLEQCILHFLADPGPHKSLFSSIDETPRSTTIHEFHSEEPELNEFLSGYPDYYSVHDFRGRVPGRDVFPYTIFGDDGFTRFKQEPLWVQRQLKGFREKLRAFWSPASLMAEQRQIAQRSEHL